MPLSVRMQIPNGAKVRVINPPNNFRIDAIVSEKTRDVILLFALDSTTLKKTGKPLFEAARADKLAWIAYPKAGQLGTDLNRDILAKLVKPNGIQPVRQVSIDDIWSALRFRPA